MSLRRYTAKPATQWEGDAMPTSRPTVVCVSALDLVAVQPIAKEEPLRSESYRRYVASYPCFACGIEGFSQCAHPNYGKGLGLKTSDADTFPLCGPHNGLIGCHQQHDLCIDMTRAMRREAEVKYTARMQWLAKADGWTEVA